ncbi:sugar phosphate isomerase/epimerase family protein [Salarchaeum japonicum]|uniref:Sugar phosphate isomerase/epimerase n=1 Tax=Salarchaeum japonicum TaxID=555573 RepID=A0AAV3T0R3_9EURY|nr:sugar phosphate isomerase/epimerase family protein [Salarchaeum japonicum]
MRSLDLGFTLGLEMSFAPTVRWAADEGFDFVELLLDGPYARQRVEPRTGEMADALDDHGVGVVVHLPFNPDPGSPFAPVREGVVEELVAGMDTAVELGAEKVVFHPSSDAWRLGWSDEETREFVHDSLDALVPAARERGLDPCLENIVSSYYDATTFPELLERYPEASMTFDTSHAHLAGVSADEMGAFLRAHGERVHHLHLVDTRGDADEHLPVGMGRLDFDPVFDALRETEWAGTATLEIGTSDLDTIAVGKKHVDAYE